MKLFSLILIFAANIAVAQLSVSSFNAGLAHTFVPLAKERLPKIITEMKKSTADVVCLQEVWTQDDMDAISNGLKELYPYSFQAPITQTKTKQAPSCGIGDLFGGDKGNKKFVSCVISFCIGQSGDSQTDCILDRCGVALKKLKNTNLECAQAMMAQVGNSAVTTVLQVINPFSPAGIFTYKGSFGLMILSKKPLANSQLIDMSTISTLTRRGALVVTVKERDKNIDLLCTHLTADLDSTAPYAGQLSGWREENEKQVVYLLGRMKDRNDSQILMGDFNCSFADPKNSINGEFESHCQRFIDMGYQDPISKNIRKCTFCSSNSVVDRGHDNTVLDVLLDHLFVRKLTVKSSRRSYENLVEILVEGKPEQSNLSDHYGVDATVE